MKDEIKRKVGRILSHDSNVSEKLSQSTMTHVEHSRLILEVLEEDVPSLIERIEQLEKALNEITELGWSERFGGGYQYMGEYHAEAIKIARQALGKEE